MDDVRVACGSRSGLVCHWLPCPCRLIGEELWTPIGRALKELGIEWIAARSPQAKGRVKRFFGTAQDRLVKGLRKAGALTLAEPTVIWKECTCRCGTVASR